uniref:Endonuclease/exonuclease/phosphatase domain-containing protein n=1 Tax=Fagus sylvatica TaxID=28930 RepID=A0A2N9G0A2_FAGSY
MGNSEVIGAHCLLGKLLSYKFFNKGALKSTMLRLWGGARGTTAHDIGKNLFVFQFQNDYERCRFHGVPLFYMTKQTGERVAFGKVEEVDVPENEVGWGHFYVYVLLWTSPNRFRGLSRSSSSLEMTKQYGSWLRDSDVGPRRNAVGGGRSISQQSLPLPPRGVGRGKFSKFENNRRADFVGSSSRSAREKIAQNQEPILPTHPGLSPMRSPRKHRYGKMGAVPVPGTSWVRIPLGYRCMRTPGVPDFGQKKNFRHSISRRLVSAPDSLSSTLCLSLPPPPVSSVSALSVSALLCLCVSALALRLSLLSVNGRGSALLCSTSSFRSSGHKDKLVSDVVGAKQLDGLSAIPVSTQQPDNSATEDSAIPAKVKLHGAVDVGSSNHPSHAELPRGDDMHQVAREASSAIPNKGTKNGKKFWKRLACEKGNVFGSTVEGCYPASSGPMRLLCRNCRGLGNPCTVRGGLAMLWSDQVELAISTYSRNHIDAGVAEKSTGKGFRLTGFYGNPKTHKHKESWALLKHLSSLSSEPWVCMGDFNEILDNSERWGWGSRPGWQIEDFRDVVVHFELHDLGFDGQPFTWRNKREAKRDDADFVIARLDRVLASASWLDRKRKRVFRFRAMWTMEEECKGVIDQAWNSEVSEGSPMFQVVKKLKGCRGSLIAWSKLLKDFTSSEVSQSLKQMYPTKAPSSDGMSAIFYQTYWEIVGLEIVSKILANRLKRVLPLVVSESQSAFVPGHLIIDNVLVAFEVMHSMSLKRRGRLGQMAIKLDMSKAYDKHDKKKRAHWIRWSQLCLCKEAGGLGFRDLRMFNQALLAKQGWRLIQQTDSLFCRVFKAKYFSGTTFMEAKLGHRSLLCLEKYCFGPQCVEDGVEVAYREWQTGLKICSGAGFSGRRFGGAFCSFGLAFIGRSLGKNCCRFVDGRHHYVAVTISPVYGVVCVQ